MEYRIEYSSRALEHIGALSAAQRAILFDQVRAQLAHQPTVETRNRKMMRPNPVAPWSLRIGDLRVYYEVVETPDPVVFVHAVGIKDRNRVRAGGKDFQV